VRLAEALAEAKWSDVSIRFKDGHTVKVTVRGRNADFDYEDFGLEDGRGNNRPKRAWELLRVMAVKDGQLHWGDRGASRAYQVQKQVLADALRTAFGMTDDPFISERGGWKARFHVREA
jgi:hypothetical protein